MSTSPAFGVNDQLCFPDRQNRVPVPCRAISGCPAVMRTPRHDEAVVVAFDAIDRGAVSARLRVAAPDTHPAASAAIAHTTTRLWTRFTSGSPHPCDAW